MQKKSSVCAGIYGEAGGQGGEGQNTTERIEIVLLFQSEDIICRGKKEKIKITFFQQLKEKIKVLESLKGEITNFESEKS